MAVFTEKKGRKESMDLSFFKLLTVPSQRIPTT